MHLVEDLSKGFIEHVHSVVVILTSIFFRKGWSVKKYQKFATKLSSCRWSLITPGPRTSFLDCNLCADFANFFGGPIFGGISENTFGRFEQFNFS